MATPTAAPSERLEEQDGDVTYIRTDKDLPPVAKRQARLKQCGARQRGHHLFYDRILEIGRDGIAGGFKATRGVRGKLPKRF